MGGMIYMKGGLKMNKCSIDKNYMNAVFSHALIKVGFCNK